MTLFVLYPIYEPTIYFARAVVREANVSCVPFYMISKIFSSRSFTVSTDIPWDFQKYSLHVVSLFQLTFHGSAENLLLLKTVGFHKREYALSSPRIELKESVSLTQCSLLQFNHSETRYRVSIDCCLHFACICACVYVKYVLLPFIPWWIWLWWLQILQVGFPSYFSQISDQFWNS